MNSISRERSVEAFCLLATATVIVFVFWEGLHAFWGRDDYMQLAFVRLLDSPWPLFTHDHFFPAPGSIFRPLGFASMWVCERFFGSNYAMNAGFDLALHVGVAFALYGVMRAAAIPRTLGFLATIAFAIHPAVIGTALWWSARFDLQATLFVLLAVRAAMVYRARPREPVRVAMAAALLAALLSKEIGIVAALPISGIFLHWAWSERAQRRRALLSVGLAWACVALYFAWRWAAIGTPFSGITGGATLSTQLGKGVVEGVQQMPGYMGFGSRLTSLQGLLLSFTCAAMAVILIASQRVDSGRVGRGSADVFATGLMLLFIPALVQAPITALNGAPLDAAMSAVSAAMQSRLYYLGCAGVALLVAGVAARAWHVAWVRLSWVAAFVVLIAVFTVVSRESAGAFAKRSNAIAAPARAAVNAIADIDLPSAPCHVALFGFEPAPEWGDYVSMDSIIKALLPDITRASRCFFHSDRATWFYLMRGDASDASAAPYTPLQLQGQRVPWLRFGGETVAYLAAPLKAVSAAPAGWIVFAWRDGRFADVSADARAGRIPLRLN